MADIKISELGAASAVNNTDLFPITSSGVTVKATAQQIKNYIGVGNLTDLNTTDKSSAVAAINEVDSHADYANLKADNVQQQVSNAYDAYDPTRPYKVKELCIYNNVLYRCVTACSAGSWATNQSCFTSDTLVNVQNMILPNTITEEFSMNPVSESQNPFVVKGTYTPLDRTVTIIFSCHCNHKVESTSIAVNLPTKYRPSANVSGCGMITTDAGGQTYGCTMFVTADGIINQNSTGSYVDAFGIIKYKI